MTINFCKKILKISKKNNKLFMLIWIFIFCSLFKKIIFVYLFLNLLSLFKFLILIKKSNNIILKINKNYLDAIIFKTLITIFKNKKKISDYLLFIFFSYFIIFIFNFSIKLIWIAVKFYNEIKYQLIKKEINIMNFYIIFKNDILILDNIHKKFKIKNIQIIPIHVDNT